MNGGRLRAALVIVAIVIGSAIAGAAIDHAVMLHNPRRFRPVAPFGSGPGAAARRRDDMLARLTKELDLAPAQRAAIDSIMQHTDSALRAVRLETQPQVQRILDSSRARISSRLDSAQRDRYAKRRPASHFRLAQ
jgi:Spy/CpxP family protein refolding chaperone